MSRIPVALANQDQELKFLCRRLEKEGDRFDKKRDFKVEEVKTYLDKEFEQVTAVLDDIAILLKQKGALPTDYSKDNYNLGVDLKTMAIYLEDKRETDNGLPDFLKGFFN